MTPEDAPATQKDLTDLKEFRQDFRQHLIAMESRLVDKLSDVQTEILRAFAAFAETQNIHLSKVEAAHSNLDASLSGRVNVLERRLLEIELRLGRV